MQCLQKGAYTVLYPSHCGSLETSQEVLAESDFSVQQENHYSANPL